MSANDEDPFGPIDPTPRKPYRPSERRPQPVEGDDNNNNALEWYCARPPDPEPDDSVDLGVHPSGFQPILQNVVSTFSMECKVDLKEVAQRARNAEYNPRRFSAVILRLREPKTTALIFSSGKGVCTGAKDEEDSKLAARKFARIIQKLGHKALFKNFQIQNLVATVDVGFQIFLEKLNLVSKLNSLYEPEIFPGLILRMGRPKVAMLIFASGKVVITGAKRRELTYEAFEKVFPLLQEHRRPFGLQAIKVGD